MSNTSKCLYFIQCDGRRGPIKIGIADDVGFRLNSLQVGCPFPLELLVSFEVEDALNAEADLHRQFRRYRIRGEWFAWSDELQAAVDEHRRRLGIVIEPRPSPIEFTWRGRRRRW